MSDRPMPRREPGFFSTTFFMRLAVGESAVLGGLAMSSHTRFAAAVAAPLVAGTLARQQGRWWAEHRAFARRFRRRRAVRPAAHRDQRMSSLRYLAPALVVRHVGPHDTGVAYDGGGWFAVAAITTDPERRDGPDRLLSGLAVLVRDCGVPGATVQLVTHTVPAPNTDLAPDCAAATSYRELSGIVGPIPADRTQWLAVRADAEALAEAGVRGPDQVPAIVAGLARRAARAASGHGRSAAVYGPDGLVAALAHSCGLGFNLAPAYVAPHEEWDAWHSGRMTHRTFWLRDWPQHADIGALLERLALVPAAFTSVALVIAAGATPAAVDVRCLVRIAGRPGDLPRACDALEAVACSLDAGLTALDGQQGPAAYASAPTGGGPR